MTIPSVPFGHVTCPIQTSAGDILIQSSAGVLHVPEGATAQESGQAGMVIGTEVVEDSGGNHHDEVFNMA